MIGYILAAGSGSRIAPYNEVRPKALLPILNRPLVSYLADAFEATPCTELRLAAHMGPGDLRSVVPRSVAVTDVGETAGTAESLAAIYSDDAPALVVPGDIIVDPADLARLADAAQDAIALLLSPIASDETGDWIGVRCAGSRVTALLGHPREGVTHRIVGFMLPRGFGSWLERTPTHFPAVEVGMMPPAERYLESAVELARAAGNPVNAVFAEHPTWDIDKPWQLLAANQAMLAARAHALNGNELGEGAAIDPTASVEGPVVLGGNSRIGRNVIVRGSLIAGDDVVIDAGAIINGTIAVGSGSTVSNACFVEDGSVIGRNCVVSHAAELDGMLFDGVYLYHYMEIYGIVGENTDIGAATVCGSLRFDDGRTAHRVKGRRELPRDHSNASFIGDYCRTGVNAILMPGSKIGPYSIVGPGVVLDRDVPPRTGIRVKQQLEEFSWGPERYGW